MRYYIQHGPNAQKNQALFVGSFAVNPGQSVAVDALTDAINAAVASGQLSITANPENYIVSLTGDTFNLTVSDVINYQGKLLVLSTAAAMTLNIPAATGSGLRLDFVVGAKEMAYNIDVTGSDGDTHIDGTILLRDSSGAAIPEANIPVYSGMTVGRASGIHLNGSTTGGAEIGDTLTFIDYLNQHWLVSGQVTTYDTPATSPFVGT